MGRVPRDSVSSQRRRSSRVTPGQPGAAILWDETDDGTAGSEDLRMLAALAPQNREYDPIWTGEAADVAELADATDLGSVTLRGVEVQILSSA